MQFGERSETVFPQALADGIMTALSANAI